MASRPTIIAGNWKMFKTSLEAREFVQTLAPLIEGSQAKVYIAPPFTAIGAISKLSASIIVGAQNMHDAPEGAFTGEISADMLLDVGAQFVILGHSERRHIFGEKDSFINKKVHRALKVSLQPIFCVGETKGEREAGKEHEVLERQLKEGLAGLKEHELEKIVIAYEPVWAIGTGIVAKPEDAQKAHHFIRTFLAKNWSQEVADSIVIQYGGSVKPENAGALLQSPDIDGLLIGGASLSAETFSEIIAIAG